MAMLVYPQGGDGGDYVTFQHFKYRSNRASRGMGNTPAEGNSIQLYMPTSTPEVANDNGWGAISNPGPIGALQQNAARIIGSEGPGKAASNAVQTLKDTFAGKGNGLVGLTHQFGVNYLSNKIGMDPNHVTQLGQGKIFNPNIELMYDGPRVRGFNMQFDFIPRSPEEAFAVQNIILEFKTWSAPGGQGQGMFEVPHVWQVTYFSGGNTRVMNKFKRAALTKVSVQANPTTDMHSTYTDGMPTSTSMALSFLEVDVVMREDHIRHKGQGM